VKKDDAVAYLKVTVPEFAWKKGKNGRKTPLGQSKENPPE
jgi:hypothetical protein